jgi:hypothetical protein
LNNPSRLLDRNPTEPEECVIKAPEKAALLNLLKTEDY